MNIMREIERTQQRRNRILRDKPKPLSSGDIITVGQRHDSVLMGHCKFFVQGKVGDDMIEACINTNPRALIVSFYVNGPAPEPIDGRFYSDTPVFNIKTGELKLIFQENQFMVDAIKYWLLGERERIVNTWKEKNA